MTKKPNQPPPQCHGEPVEPWTGQSGITLVEILIATAIFIVVGFTLFQIVRNFSISTMKTAGDLRQRADAAHLADTLEADQQSAEAIFIPDIDVLGQSNASPHEVDFYAVDGANRPYYWAYYYDSTAHTLQRYNYASPGAPATPADSLFSNVVTFNPTDHAISEITNPSSPIYIPIFTSARDYDVPIGAGSKIQAGTHIIHIALSTPKQSIPIDLAAASAPSGFTIVLNYTPAPSTTATPPALIVEPASIKYATAGSSLASAPGARRQFNLAQLINGMLGGGIAAASGVGNCPAIAYQDASFQMHVTGQEAADLGADPATGCYDGHVRASEGSGTFGGAFQSAMGSCDGILTTGAWSGYTTLSPDNLPISAGRTAISSCTFSISDGRSTPQSAAVVAQVVVPITAHTTITYATQPGNCNVTQDPTCMNNMHTHESWYKFDGAQWNLVYWSFYDEGSNPIDTSGGNGTMPSGPNTYEDLQTCVQDNWSPSKPPVMTGLPTGGPYC